MWALLDGPAGAAGGPPAAGAAAEGDELAELAASGAAETAASAPDWGAEAAASEAAALAAVPDLRVAAAVAGATARFYEEQAADAFEEARCFFFLSGSLGGLWGCQGLSGGSLGFFGVLWDFCGWGVLDALWLSVGFRVLSGFFVSGCSVAFWGPLGRPVAL